MVASLSWVRGDFMTSLCWVRGDFVTSLSWVRGEFVTIAATMAAAAAAAVPITGAEDVCSADSCFAAQVATASLLRLEVVASTGDCWP